MKSLLLSITLFLLFPVPNTTTFSFSDVKAEIENNGGGTILSLQDAFNAANSSGFYEYTPGETYFDLYGNSLLAFRNYSHAVSTISISPTSYFFSSIGGSEPVYVTTFPTNAWNITYPRTVWLKITPSYGTGNGSFEVLVLENFTDFPRSVVVTINSSLDPITLVINQSPPFY